MTVRNSEKLNQILSDKHITPVYQPIVSLTDGTVYAYEALSRISCPQLQMDIENLFDTADHCGKLWELESLCRTKALEGFAGADSKAKLFLNVNPNLIHDRNFKQGFTRKRLSEFGISPDRITFEITERASVLQSNLFFKSVRHYKNQDYGIAIDDVGSGYSGLNVIVDVKPSFIKLDMHLVRNIDKDETKLLLCKALSDFCKGADIRMIAEGIESEEELRELIRLGVDYGQGFFLGLPKPAAAEILPEKKNLITCCHSKQFKEHIKSSIYPTVEHLCKRGSTFSMEQQVEEIDEILSSHPAIMEFTVLDGDVAAGFMTRADLNTALGGRYGYSLNARKTIGQLLTRDFLRVNCDMTVEQVARLAMERNYEQLYHPIVVEKENRYLGIMTIKDLLDTCTRIEVDAAMHSNPLTGLPGNLLIEKEIISRLFEDRPYCITYYDLDSFKAYNDAYGFENGDLMLKLVAATLQKCAVQNEFLGHIGGDDFIVVADYEDGEDFCRSVIDMFGSKVVSLYRDEDLSRGYIISKNRNGVTENFPIASISIAGVTSRGKRYRTIDDFSRDVALLKKSSKKQPGNSYHLI